jgi:lipid A 3-O-deacylase
MNRLVIAAILLLPLPGAHAQTLEEQFRAQAETKPKERFLTLTVENDSLGAGTDRDYTSGVRLSWFDTSAIPPAAARSINPFLPLLSINDTTSVYYSLGQNLYAPRNLHLATPDPTDRPYAGFLYGSMGLVSITDNRLDYVEFTAGVVGPWALGEPTQKFVHSITGSDNPQGWDHQLENELGLMVSWQRLWPKAYTSELGNLHFRTSPYGGATLGNVYTYASTGVLFQLMPQEYKWQDLPLRIRPAMPGSGYFSVPEGEFAWSVFAGLEGRAMGRNIFLDGNTFQDSPSVDKRFFVGDINLGVAFTYGRTQLSYTVNWRSEEFSGQEKPDIFGAVGLGYRF